MLQSNRWVVLLALGLTTASASAAPKADPLVGKSAPSFNLAQLDGTRLSLASLKGKVVLLNFWDFGCPSCNQEVEHLERLHRKYTRQGLRVVGIAELAPEPKRVKLFLREHRTTYPVLLDSEQNLARKYSVTAHPATIILDRKGIVRYVHTGFLRGDEFTLENSVKALLEGEKLARR